MLDALAPLEANLNELIAAQQRAEEEQASRESLKAIQRAFREAMLALPREEYDWFEVPARKSAEGASSANSAEVVQTPTPSLELNGGETFGVPEPTASAGGQRQFFEALLTITMEGFFADPIYGGNRDKAGWRMVGYPGLPATYASIFEQYRGKKYVAEPKSIADFS